MISGREKLSIYLEHGQTNEAKSMSMKEKKEEGRTYLF
jgi:hypothetical protein